MLLKGAFGKFGAAAAAAATDATPAVLPEPPAAACSFAAVCGILAVVN